MFLNVAFSICCVGVDISIQVFDIQFSFVSLRAVHDVSIS